MWNPHPDQWSAGFNKLESKPSTHHSSHNDLPDISNMSAQSWRVALIYVFYICLAISFNLLTYITGGVSGTSTTDLPVSTKRPVDDILQINQRLASEDHRMFESLFEGDILMLRTPTAFSPDVTKWINKAGTVEIAYVLDPSYTPDHIWTINEAFRDIEENTCIRFVNHTNQRDYIFIMPGLGCYSSIGRKGRKQIVSMSFDCLARGKGIVLHELLHVLGFWHEHSRADRDNYIRIIWSAIKKGSAQNFCKYDTTNMIVNYTFGSILHYSGTAFAEKPGLKTIVPLTNAEIGQRLRLHEMDIVRINKLYCTEPEEYLVQVSPPEIYDCGPQNADPELKITPAYVSTFRQESSFISIPNDSNIQEAAHFSASISSFNQEPDFSPAPNTATSQKSKQCPAPNSCAKEDPEHSPTFSANPEPEHSPAPKSFATEEPEHSPASTSSATHEPENSPALVSFATQEPEHSPAPTSSATQEPNYSPAPKSSTTQTKHNPAPISSATREPEHSPAPTSSATQEPNYSPAPKSSTTRTKHNPAPIASATREPELSAALNSSATQELEHNLSATLESKVVSFASPISTLIGGPKKDFIFNFISDDSSTPEVTQSSVKVTLFNTQTTTDQTYNGRTHTSIVSSLATTFFKERTKELLSPSIKTSKNVDSGLFFSQGLEGTTIQEAGHSSWILPAMETKSTINTSVTTTILETLRSTVSKISVAAVRMTLPTQNLKEENSSLKKTMSSFIFQSTGIPEQISKDSVWYPGNKDVVYLPDQEDGQLNAEVLKKLGKRSLPDSREDNVGFLKETKLRKKSVLKSLHEIYYLGRPLAVTNKLESLCGFEAGMCGWKQSTDDDLDWSLAWGSVNVANSHLKAGGLHLSLKNHQRNRIPEQRAILVRTIMQPFNCISLWYGYRHSIMGTLNIYIVSNSGKKTLLWSAGGEEERRRWTNARIDLPPSLPPYHDVQVVVEGVADPMNKSKIVIDNLYVGNCT